MVDHKEVTSLSDFCWAEVMTVTKDHSGVLIMAHSFTLVDVHFFSVVCDTVAVKARDVGIYGSAVTALLAALVKGAVLLGVATGVSFEKHRSEGGLKRKNQVRLLGLMVQA